MIDLTGNTILITGASSGIGAATARLCYQQGATLVLTGRNKNALENLQKELSGVTILPEIDLTNTAHLEQLVANVPELDGVFLCAGIVKPFPIKFIQEKQYNEVFDVNLKSNVLLVAKLFKKKKISKGASLVLMSSVSASFPYVGGALYTSSKAAMESFSRSIALEYAPQRIRCNVVSPGLVKTRIFEETIQASSEEQLKIYEASYPLGFGEPEDVAHAVCFLLSNASKWITGENIRLDGGLTLGSK